MEGRGEEMKGRKGRREGKRGREEDVEDEEGDVVFDGLTSINCTTAVGRGCVEVSVEKRDVSLRKPR